MLIGAVIMVTLGGCYTQLSVVRQAENAADNRDSVSSQNRSVDTIKIKEREVCYWTYDFWGRPILRCDETDYPREWYYSQYSPWWYRHDPMWFDYDRCPRYYYYNRECGCCRYYQDNPDYYYGGQYYGGGGSGSSGSVGPAATPKRSKTYGVPNSSEVRSSTILPKAGEKAESPKAPPADTSPSSPVQSKASRTYGIPLPSEIKPAQNQNAPTTSSEAKTTAPSAPSDAAPQKPAEASPPDTAQTRPRDRRYRDPRSW
jgi:hypothetical protein